MTADQLRKSILQQAIQGKLVPQDPNDEPASVLLERIREEKARLVKEKKAKREKNPSIIYRGEDNSYYEEFTATGEVKCIDDEIPFDLPDGWVWARLENVVELINGRAYKREELLQAGKYKVLRVGNLFTNHEWFYSDLDLPEDKYCQNGDLLYAWSASFGPHIWTGTKTIFHYHIWNVRYNRQVFVRDYLYYFLEYDKSSIRSSTTGSTMIHVSKENMNPRFIPLPPLAEQERIVAKIEELMPWVEQYGKAQSELDQLNNSIQGRLRKSVLQYAIEGKLVPQQAEDGSAEELLAEIQAEKQRLYAAGKLKKKDLAHSTIFRAEDGKYYEQVGKTITCIDEEIPFDLPDGWVWARLENLFQIGPKVLADDHLSAAFIPMEAITAGYGSEYRFYERVWGSIKSGYTVFSDNDIAFAKITPCFQNRKSVIFEGLPNGIGAGTTELKVLRTYGETMIRRFALYFLKSPYFIEEASFKGTANQQRILVGYLESKLFPLPPLAEQQRIVSKLEEVLGVMNRLGEHP